MPERLIVAMATSPLISFKSICKFKYLFISRMLASCHWPPVCPIYLEWSNRLLPRVVISAMLAVFLAACQTTGIEGEHASFTTYTPSGDGARPAVLVLPVRGGMNAYTQEFAKRLSREGYVTAAADFFTGPLEPVYDYLQARADVDPVRIGLVGFSKGAQYSLEMSRFWQFTKKQRPVRAVVSYYIGNGVPTARREYPPALFLHGDLDDVTPPDSIARFCERQREFGNVCDYHIYENTTHSFTHESLSWGTYHPENERDAYRRAVDFLNQHLAGYEVPQG
ncbi:MAG TPA: dienelactone hydrolase family protein [Thermohalobaculum sp.]|nr:dienelactone hydrolase family protein [Thermohalobaculum sp.]